MIRLDRTNKFVHVIVIVVYKIISNIIVILCVCNARATNTINSKIQNIWTKEFLESQYCMINLFINFISPLHKVRDPLKNYLFMISFF